jgi:diacylglycerol kinase (ATP)
LSLRARLRSLGHALDGLALLLRSQPNAWIHAVATVLVVALGSLLQVSAYEWLWLLLAMALVWMAEAFNTALERLADAVSHEQHPLIGQAKDLAAGAVLVAALAAAVIGMLILGPRLLHLLG